MGQTLKKLLVHSGLGQKFQDPRVVPDLLLGGQEVLVALGPLPLQPLVHHVQEEALAVQVLRGHLAAVRLDLILVKEKTHVE